MINADLTPTFITFVDSKGRNWQALALIAPLTAEDMEPVHLGDTADLELKIRKVKIVRR